VRRAIILFLAATVAACAFAEAPKQAPRKAKAKAKVQTKAAPVQNAHRRDPYVGAMTAIDDGNGNWRILSEQGERAEAYPASVTKLMTLLLVLEDVRAGKYGFETKVTVTPDVNRCEASWIGLKVGDEISVRDLCIALMVESANDAAIVLGVNSAGSFDGFVARMNSRARELGMTATHYYNPNGLPPNGQKRYPWKSFNVSTAADQLQLAIALLKMPEVTIFTSVKTADLVKTATGSRVAMTRRVNQPHAPTQLKPGETLVKQLCNHNHIMVKDKLHIFNPDGKEAVDGLKTGYINAGGSSVVLTGTRNGRRAIVVVLGSASSQIRDANARRLMIQALNTLDKP